MKQGNSHRFVTEQLPATGGKVTRIVLCDICGGMPGMKFSDGTLLHRSLTSDCSGSKHTADQVCAIADGTLDYRNGKWIDLKVKT